MRKMAIAAILVLFASLILLAFVDSSKSLTFFNDEFNDDSSLNWLPARGTWRESGGEYLTSAGASISVVSGLNLTDCVIETQMRLTEPINFRAGIVYRYVSNLDYYSFEIGNQFNEIDIIRYSPVSPAYGETGAYVQPAFNNSSITIVPNTNYTLRIEIQGTHFNGYINNQKVLSWSDSAYSSGTVGLRASSAGVSFDYIKAYSISPLASPTDSQSPVVSPTNPQITNTPPALSPTPALTPASSSVPTGSSQPTASPTSPPSPSPTPITSSAITAFPEPSSTENPNPSPSIPEVSTIMLLPTIIAASLIAAYFAAKKSKQT